VAQQDAGNVVPGTSNFAYYGAKGVTSKGFEAQVSGELARGWNLSAGLARTIATDVDGSAINSWAPRTQLQLFSTYRLQGDWQRLTVGGGFNWQNRTYYPLSTSAGDMVYEQKAFGIVNLMVRYAFSPQLSLQANLNNLLDKKHYANISGQGQFGTPRNAQVALNYRF
jgi:outer membrane receptor for ferric coprogen and ferric-rhodotorulic acid